MIVDVDPKVDYAFKYVFGRDAARPILIDVIDAVLQLPADRQIQEIELLNPFNDKEAVDDKTSILDIKARDQAGRQFNIEMQILAFPYYEKRILYYGCRLHQQQLKEGQDYLELRPTISISFLDHILFPDVQDHHLRFRLLEESRHFPLTDDLEFHILELPKFTKQAHELVSVLDIWLYFLRHAAKIDTEAVPTQLRHALVLRALEDLKMLKQTDLNREQYEARRKFQLDENTRVRVARMEGHEAGQQRGEKIGTIRLCEQLLQRPNTPTDRLTNLSLEELTRLADDLQEQLTKKSNLAP